MDRGRGENEGGVGLGEEGIEGFERGGKSFCSPEEVRVREAVGGGGIDDGRISERRRGFRVEERESVLGYGKWGGGGWERDWWS